jgi:hypothetical protein
MLQPTEDNFFINFVKYELMVKNLFAVDSVFSGYPLICEST